MNYGNKAYKLNSVMQSMNNEYAYNSWIYIYPDGATESDCKEYFATKEDFEELEDSFKRIYKRYHKDGIYRPTEEDIKTCRKYDKLLGLSPIEVL